MSIKPDSAIVIDETQDLGPQALRLLRAMIASNPNDLFFVGDGHQRIYTRNRAAMSKCGIDGRAFAAVGLFHEFDARAVGLHDTAGFVA